MKKLLRLTAKLVLVAGIILAIAAGMVSMAPDGEVKEANADITDLVPYKSWEGRSYSKVMSETGLNIRAYDLNGNTMYFGLGKTEKAPKQVLKDLQEAFVTAKINDRPYLDVPQSLYAESTQNLIDRRLTPDSEEFQYLEAMVTGEIVPIRVGSERIVMGGMMPEAGAQQDAVALFEAIGTGGSTEAGVFKGFRYLEARRDPKTGVTTVESTWADEDFDWRKMENPDKYADLEQGDVRRCPGCSTQTAMKSLNPGEDYYAQQFTSQTPAPALVDFYDTTLGEQGWERSEAGKFLNGLQNERGYGMLEGIHHLDYSRGDQWKSILISPSGDDRGGVSVTAVEAD